MTFVCKTYCQHCVTDNRANHYRRGGVSLHPLRIPEYPWEIVEMNYVINLPKGGTNGSTTFFIMVCHLTKLAHLVPCHKEITTEE